MMPYKDILICFGNHWKNIIFCLDMRENTFYQSPKSHNTSFHDVLSRNKYYFVSIDGGRYCHYYNTKYSKHLKIDLFDACPKELQKKIEERMNIKNMKICFGFCRENERRFNKAWSFYHSAWQ